MLEMEHVISKSQIASWKDEQKMKCGCSIDFFTHVGNNICEK